ncbi:hypothetical protein [Pantoea sp. SJZ147]|nr:hypothetical protein [Pantoea sp. SJZ147]
MPMTHEPLVPSPNRMLAVCQSGLMGNNPRLPEDKKQRRLHGIMAQR